MALFNGAYTNVASQLGMPLFGVSGVPAFTGNVFWVDETNGSDGNTGGPQDPFKTLKQAHASCLSGNNDVVFLSGTAHQTATLTWSKNKTHLIGLSLSPFGSALISVSNVAATTGAFTPLVNVTGTGCIFQNISTLSGIAQAAAQVCWAEAGGQNTYIGCQFNQVGHLTAAAHAGNRALTLASLNNLFQNCVIGGDAVLRATGTNFTMEFLATSGSSIFRGCVFPMYTSNTADAHINAATTTMTGYVLFDDCQFIQDVANASEVTIAAAIINNASSGGAMLLTPTTISLGATAIATTGPVYFVGMNPGGANSATTGSIAILAT